MRTIREICEEARVVAEDPATRAGWALHLADLAPRLDRQERAAHEARLRRLGVHGEHWPHLASCTMTPAIWYTGEFLAATGPKSGILVLSGGKGAGKSFAAALAVHARGGRVIQAQGLVQASLFDSELWEDLAWCRLLAVDDLGTEAKDEKGWFDAKLFALLDGRLGAGKKTIITTNLAGGPFTSRYCTGALDRLKRRLEEFGRFVPIGIGRPGELGP